MDISVDFHGHGVASKATSEVVRGEKKNLGRVSGFGQLTDAQK
jgi:hypothetical protein